MSKVLMTAFHYDFMTSLSKERTVKKISPKIKKKRQHLGRVPQPNCAIAVVLHIIKQFLFELAFRTLFEMDPEQPDSTCQSSIFTQMLTDSKA